MRVPVSRRALILRIRRTLQEKGQDLKQAKGGNKRKVLGAYFIIDKNGVVETNISLEKLARRLNLLEPFEALEND